MENGPFFNFQDVQFSVRWTTKLEPSLGLLLANRTAQSPRQSRPDLR